MRVVWGTTARKQRGHAILYTLDSRGPDEAVALDARFEHASTLLAQPPRPGRQGAEAGTMEYVLSKVPYILVYRVHSTHVEVIALHHTARKRH